MIRIAVDARVVQDRYHGIGRYTLELLRVMRADERIQWILIHGGGADRRLTVRELAGTPNIEFVEWNATIGSVMEQLGWPRLLRRLRPDVLLVPYHLAVPWLCSVPVVSVLHDCIMEADRSYAPSLRVWHLYRFVTWIALARSATVVTVSDASRVSAAEHYGIAIPTDNLVRSATDPRFSERCTTDALALARARLGLPGRYILHVGVRRPHKNLPTLIKAFGALARTLDPPVDLVLVGGSDDRFPDPLDDLVASIGVRGRVHELRDVPEELLPAVYQGASAFAFPSFVEGFGMPVVEAMAAGVPVVASDTAAVAEASAGGALLVPPSDVAGWTAALGRILEDRDLRAELRARGTAVTERFGWEAAGRRLLQVLHGAARWAQDARGSADATVDSEVAAR